MPKMKTCRAARKRFKVTGTGKVMRHTALRRHLLTKKDKARKRGGRLEREVSPTDVRRVRRMLPYS